MNIFMIAGLLFILCLFLLILGCLFLGRKYALRLESHSTDKKGGGGVQVTRGTIFALLGLLLAFTFSGAMTKFDQRRALIVDEANAISTLHLRFSLLPVDTQKILNQDLNQYLNLRIKTYRTLPDLNAAKSYFVQSLSAQDTLWKDTIEALSKSNTSYHYLLIVPVLNKVFDVANLRVNLTQMHPPYFIFILIILVALVSAFILGSTINEKRSISPPHVIIFSLVISVIIFSIVDMEYPRLGFIRVDAFDHALVNVQNRIKG